jgi:hypothetical protein
MNTSARCQMEPSIAIQSRPDRRVRARSALSVTAVATAAILALTVTAAHASPSGVTGFAAHAAAKASLDWNPGLMPAPLPTPAPRPMPSPTSAETGCCA